MHKKRFRLSLGLLSLAVALTVAAKPAHATSDGSCPDSQIFAIDPANTSITGWCSFVWERDGCWDCMYDCPWGMEEGNWCPT